MPGFSRTTLKAQPFAFVTLSCPLAQIGQTIQEGFGRLGAAFSAAHAAPAGPPLAHYRSLGEGKVVFDLGFPVREGEAEAVRASGLSLGGTASGEAVIGLHLGPYDSISGTYDALLAEMRALGLRPARDVWEVYFSAPGTPPEQMRTEVIWPAAA